MKNTFWEKSWIAQKIKAGDLIVFCGFHQTQCHVVRRRAGTDIELYDVSHMFFPTDTPNLCFKVVVHLVPRIIKMLRVSGLSLKKLGVFDASGLRISTRKSFKDVSEVRYIVGRITTHAKKTNS